MKDEYNQIDHSHCWESKNPPCGQKIKHFECCLCKMPNPETSPVRNKMKDEDIIKKFREKFGFYWSKYPDQTNVIGLIDPNDNRPISVGIVSVEQFILSILHQDRQDRDKELVEEIRKKRFTILNIDRLAEVIKFSDIETLINNRK